MKEHTRILCFGDSNTWGYMPETGGRYPGWARWTGRLQRMLGEDYEVLEFGLNGCNTGFAELEKPYDTNAQNFFPSVWYANLPVDVLILMLGTNDLKTVNHTTGEITGKNLKKMIQLCRLNQYKGRPVRIILAAPIHVEKEIAGDPQYDSTAVERSREMSDAVRRLSAAAGCEFFDTNRYMPRPGCDGCHFTAEGHQVFAENIYNLLMKG